MANTGAGIRVNDRRYRVDQATVPVDSAYQFKVFMTDAPNNFSVTSPTGVTSLFEDAPIYSQPTLPGWQ